MCQKKIIVYGLGDFFKRFEKEIYQQYEVVALTDRQSSYAKEYELYIQPHEIFY